MITLPQEFLSRMKELLGSEYNEFLSSYDAPRQLGLRVNTLKISPAELKSSVPFHLHEIPWTSNGFYYGEDCRPAQHPFYNCGLYYLQEPSAMTPATLLPVEPGDSVLDLCAAPGGKATELGARLRGEGLLVANDISNSRAKALLRNLELFGISNAFVTNEYPEKLSRFFPEYFNKILIDAPCSGEGMFRKEPAVAKAWTPDKPDTCAKMQREIVSQAIEMLTPGGLMLYSTCTFAPIENEGTISYILDNFPEMELQEISGHATFDSGVPDWGNGSPELTKCLRIWPHHSEGEGHFIALLKKKGTPYQPARKAEGKISKTDKPLLEEFFSSFFSPLPWEQVEVRGGKAYLLPPMDVKLSGVHFLRNGLFLGELKKNRFEPSQQLALASKKQDFISCLNMEPDDDRISRYLKGETLMVSDDECANKKGWQLVCVGGYPLGWGKLVNGILKNKYPSGWRL